MLKVYFRGRANLKIDVVYLFNFQFRIYCLFSFLICKDINAYNKF